MLTYQLFLLLRYLLRVEFETVDDRHVDLDLLRLSRTQRALELDPPGEWTGLQGHFLDAQVSLLIRADLKEEMTASGTDCHWDVISRSVLTVASMKATRSPLSASWWVVQWKAFTSLAPPLLTSATQWTFTRELDRSMVRSNFLMLTSVFTTSSPAATALATQAAITKIAIDRLGFMSLISLEP